MPLSHRVLAAWYIQLAQQLEAGLTLKDALRMPAGGRQANRVARAMAAQIEAGGSADDALRAAGRWLPPADQLTLSAAADVGRMPALLRNLAARHAQLGAAKLRILLACLYPLGVLHLGLVLLPVMRMIDWDKGFEWNTGAYFRMLGVTLLPLWGAIILVAWLARRRSRGLRRVAAALPALHGYLRAQALGDLSFALGNFLEAGVSIGDAWAIAGLVTPSPQLKPAAEAISGAVARGEQPGRRLATWPCFPPDFVAAYCTGETTGQLDVTLLRLSGQYQDVANRSLALATMIYPALMFLVVAGAVATSVFMLYAGYLKMVMKLAQ